MHGIRSQVPRNTLDNTNEQRDWYIHSDLAQLLIQQERELYADDPAFSEIDHAIYEFDPTSIDLCLSLFLWAQFRQQKAAIKVHTQMDIHGNIPVFLRMTEGHDIHTLDYLVLEAGAQYIMGCVYLDFTRLYCIHQHSAFFVIWAKSNLNYQQL